MSQFDKNFSLESSTGAQLNVYHMKAQANARGIVHINHGLAEHALRYAAFAEALCEAGYHVYAHDHRGHGHTKAQDAPQSVFAAGASGIEKVLQDCAQVQSLGQSEYPELPLIMFGHSMGALITMNFALRHAERLAGAAVWNTNFDAGFLGRLAQLVLKYERFRLGSDVPSRILPKLTFDAWGAKIPNHRTKFDWLSHIDREVDRYIDDPLCGWDASVGMWMDIFEMIFAGSMPAKNSTPKAMDLPFQIIGGGEDPSTDFGKATINQAERLKKAGFNNVQSHVFPNARHETLNDSDASEATSKFISFAHSCCLE